MKKENIIDGKFKKTKKEAKPKEKTVKKNKEENNGGIAGENLRRYIERIKKLEDDKAGLAGEIRDIYTRAKGEGFDPKVMRQVLKIKRMDPAERQEMESLLDIYLHALGLQLQLPLEDAV